GFSSHRRSWVVGAQPFPTGFSCGEGPDRAIFFAERTGQSWVIILHYERRHSFTLGPALRLATPNALFGHHLPSSDDCTALGPAKVARFRSDSHLCAVCGVWESSTWLGAGLPHASKVLPL